MEASWRDHARPIIAQVIRDVGKADPKKLRQALRDAYPYGERSMWPYKVWCDEVRRQLGLKSSMKADAPDPRQETLL